MASLSLSIHWTWSVCYNIMGVTIGCHSGLYTLRQVNMSIIFLQAMDWELLSFIRLFVISHNCLCFPICRISGKILEFETVTQTEATRRRYRYLSHFSLTTSFQVHSFFNFLEQFSRAYKTVISDNFPIFSFVKLI